MGRIDPVERTVLVLRDQDAVIGSLACCPVLILLSQYEGQEFISAYPAGYVIPVNAAPYYVRKADEHLVAHLMAIQIIYQLEIVQIQDHKDPTLLLAAGGYLCGTAGLVQEARQPVNGSLLGQRLDGPAVGDGIFDASDQDVFVEGLADKI